MEKSQKNFNELLITTSSNSSTTLQAALNLKKLLKHPDKTFSRLKLESLLQSVKVSVKTKSQRGNLLLNYRNYLMQYFGKDICLDKKFICYFDYLLTKLQNENTVSLDELITKIWNEFRVRTVFPAGNILDLSKEYVETIVLNWIDIDGSPDMELLAEMSSGSPKLFQYVTSLLYTALTKTGGHDRVLRMTHMFIQLVKCACLREKQDFLKLYPKNCCQIVSIFMVSPETYSERGYIVREMVSSLYEIFMSDRKKALILLSHYSEWVPVFSQYRLSDFINCT